MSQIDTRIAIIRAAEVIIKTQGLAKLTLSQVAKEAGVSKGGLLYHFPSKEALIQGMLEYALGVFSSYIDKHIEHDKEGGAWARGYIKGTFSPPNSLTGKESASASALVAGSGLNPSLLKPYIDIQQEWIPCLCNDGLDEMTALLIRFAVDGLWLNEALGIKPLNSADRTRFIEHLLLMTRSKEQ
ncbi:TetR/AcrR family transcriptional regulator [Pseudomonas aeruginosa]|nr:TetR/AcrR family transcriptional regulator [Pseudomonas aeruginosa]